MAENDTKSDRIMTLSIAGGTGIAAEKVLGCPHYHYQKYELGWRIKRMPHPLAFGICIHDCCFVNDFDRFTTAWERGTILNDKDEPAWPIARDESDIEGDVSLAKKMFDVFQEKDLELKDIEAKFETPIINPLDGKTPSHLEGVWVSGRRDMVEIYHGSEDISDLKTAAKRWPEHQARGEPGLPTYRYLEACCGYKSHNTGHYLALTKTKSPVLQRNTIKMGDNDFFAVYTKFKAAAEAILRYRGDAKGKKKPAAAWPKTGPCLGKFQQLCQFHPLCFPERYDNPAELVNENLQAKV